MYAVIMAGGGGTRLWPKSLEKNPKQMHALAGEKPLVEETVDRLADIVGQDNVYIITNQHHADLIRDLIPTCCEKVLVDPFRRDTGPCIGLAAMYLSLQCPDAVMGVFAADHYIGDAPTFSRIVGVGEKLAAEGHVVTIGIKPTEPATGYGYIECGDRFRSVDGVDVYYARRFAEKPDLETAIEYYSSGRYLWNSGMFVWSIPTVLSLFEKHLPDVYERLMRIRDAVGTESEHEVLMREYDQMQRISVDYGIMEKLDEILVIPGDFGWNDVGSWTTVYDLSPHDEDGDAVRGLHLGIDTKNCLVVGPEGKVIATIGIEDLVVVDTEGALLVCRKDRAQDVKKIVDALKGLGMEEYL
jgi:mannose-1-phosphate guanylyltransferase